MMLLGCGGTSSPPAPVDVAVAPVPVSAEAPPPSEPPPPPPSPCGEVPPVPAALPEPDRPETCGAPPVALEASVATDLKTRFQPASPGITLGVKLRCDGLDAPVDTVTFAHGAGHGFNLSLYRFSRDDERFVVRGMRYQEGGYIKRPPKLTLVEGEVPSVDVDAVIAQARLALSADLTEVVPPPPPGTLGLRGFSSSSHDFHIAVELRTQRHRRQGRFSGYAGSSTQLKYLGLRLIEDALQPWLSKLTELDREPNDEDRALFADHFLHEAPHFDDDFNWWVKERYVAMAKTVGSRALIVPLVSRLKNQDDRSTKDTTDDALAAMLTITGWDGAERNNPDPAREHRIDAYRRVCRRD